MVNPATIFQVKNAWDKFDNNHPRFKQFVNAAKDNAVKEGSVIEISIQTEDGQSMCTNIKVQQSDLELLAVLKDLALKNK